MNKIMVILGVVILIALGGVLLLGNSQSNNQPTAQQQNTETPTEAVSNNQSTDSGRQASVKEITIESKGLKFIPDILRAKVGDRVRVIYKNTFGKHDFVIDEFNVRTPLIDANEIATVEFVADKRGAFEFYCSVPGHREAGMKGTLLVE